MNSPNYFGKTEKGDTIAVSNLDQVKGIHETLKELIEKPKEVQLNKELSPLPLKDNVYHPSHYTSGSTECIEAMISAFGEEAVANFCLCNVFKYLWRHKKKNGLEDIQKASWYLSKYEKLCYVLKNND